MSDTKGNLKLRIKVGESITIGDSEIKFEGVSDSGWSVHVCVIADRTIKIGRKKTDQAPQPDRGW